MDEIEVDGIRLIIESYYPGDPGRFSGPPENCWPSESSEIEFFVAGADNKNLPKDVYDNLNAISDYLINDRSFYIKVLETYEEELSNE